MRGIILCSALAFVLAVDKMYAQDVSDCISAMDAGVANRLWHQNVDVRQHFITTDPRRQHQTVDQGCNLVEYEKKFPNQGYDPEGFEYGAGEIWVVVNSIARENEASPFGVFAALHELSHGKVP